MVGLGVEQSFFQPGRQTLKKGPLRIRDSLVVPQGWYLALETADRCEHSVFEPRQK